MKNKHQTALAHSKLVKAKRASHNKKSVVVVKGVKRSNLTGYSQALTYIRNLEREEIELLISSSKRVAKEK